MKPKRRRRILDAQAQPPRELTRERGPRPEREVLTATILEQAVARLQRLDRLEAERGA